MLSDLPAILDTYRSAKIQKICHSEWLVRVNNYLHALSPFTTAIGSIPAVNVGKADIPLERLESTP